MATVADLLTSVKYQIRDGGTNKWPGAELIDYVNRGYRLIWTRLVQLKSDFVVKTLSKTISPGIGAYLLPNDFWAVNFLKVEGESLKLYAVDFSELPNVSGDSLISEDDYYILTEDGVKIALSNPAPVGTGTPDSYTIGEGYFILSPVPLSAGSMLVSYFYKPVNLTDTSDTPFNGIADESLIAFVVEMALAREEHNTARNQSAISSLLRMADILFKRRNKALRRITAYRWEYEGLI
jgi:hypothetical protein